MEIVRREDGLRRDELRNVVVAKMERETEIEEGERQVNQENRRGREGETPLIGKKKGGRGPAAPEA